MSVKNNGNSAATAADNDFICIHKTVDRILFNDFNRLWRCNYTTITTPCGGGGIPVVLNGHHLKGASAVIDKDYASCLLAKELDADMLIILTAVEKVAVNFGKENEEWLDDITVDDAKKYINEGQFAPGSMLPKVQAAVDFASSKEGRTAMITLLQKAKDGIQGKTGTKIHL